MKKALAVFISFLSLSCQEGLVFNTGVKLLEVNSKAKGFDIAIDRRNVGLITNGTFTYASLRNNYYDSSRLSERCLYTLKSENLLLKINNEGEIVSSRNVLPLPQQVRMYNNKPYYLANNYTTTLDIFLKKYDEEFQELQNIQLSLTPYVKSGYSGYSGIDMVFLNENEFLLVGNLFRNTNGDYTVFIAIIKDGKVSKYYQMPDIIGGGIMIRGGVLINQNEIIFLGYGGVNINAKYRLYRYKVTENTLGEELEFPFGMEAESYFGIEKINSTSVALIPIETYPKSLNFKNGGIQIYDFENKKLKAKPFEIEGISSSILSVKGFNVFDGQVLIDAELDQGRTIVKLQEDGSGKAVFRRQTNFGNLMYFKNQKNELEMIEIGDIQLPRSRSKSVFVRHSGLDKFTIKTLFESVYYNNPCFN